MLIQPSFIGQLGQGWYWRSSGIATWNTKNSEWYWPVGLGFGKAFKVEKKLSNAFVEPQFTVAHSGDVWPQFQVSAVFNIQFLKWYRRRRQPLDTTMGPSRGPQSAVCEQLTMPGIVRQALAAC